MRRAAALALLAAVTCAPAAAAQEAGSTPERADEPTPARRAVVGAGHVDLGPRFVDGSFRVQVRDDTVEPSVWRELDDVVLQVKAAARVTVPDEPRFAFLGPAGSALWLLPQVQDEGLLWPGWHSHDPEVARRVRRELTWRLHRVEGPGTFVLFSTDGFGAPSVIFDTAKPMPQETAIEVDAHVHGNWGFSAPGTYLLDIEMRALLTDGRQVSDRGTLRFFVGDRGAERAFSAELPDTDAGASSVPLLVAGALPALLALAVVVRRVRTAR